MKNESAIDRHLGYDLLRILAAIGVIIIHVSAPIMTMPYLYIQGDSFWWFSNVLDSFSRFSVPVFVIFSGYSFSLLIKMPDFVENSKKKLKKLIEITAFWSFIFIAYRLIKGDFNDVSGLFNVLTLAVIKPILAGLPYFHLWYLYMALGLFVSAMYLVPLLNKLPDNMIKKVLVFLVTFCSLISLQNYYYDNKILFVFWFLEYLFYFAFGFYLYKLNMRIKSSISIVGFIVVITLNSVLVAYMVGMYGADRGQYFYEFVSPFVMLQTILIFSIFKSFDKKSSQSIVLLARLTLPAYLVHPFITELIVPTVRDAHSILFLICGIFMSVFLSFLLSYGLYKIPGVRRVAV